MTKEHRENLAKNAKQLFVKCKDHIKDLQNKEMKQLKKKDGVSEDSLRSVEQQIKAMADVYVGEAEKILEGKQKELTGKE